METNDLAPLIYRANCLILDRIPEDYAALPSHRKVRWERIALEFVTTVSASDRTLGDALYTAIHFDCIYRYWDKLNRETRAVYQKPAHDLWLAYTANIEREEAA